MDRRKLIAAVMGGRAIPWYMTGGIPRPVAAWQAIGAASITASYVNIANPGTYDLTVGNVPTWAKATGWTFDGAADFLRTTIVPATGWSLVCRLSNTNNEGVPVGSHTLNTSRFYLWPSSGGVKKYANGNIVNVDDIAVSGVMGFAGQQPYMDGLPVGAAIGDWSGTATQAIYIGCRNLSGIESTFYDGKVQALAIYNSILTGAQMAAISAKMAALTETSVPF